MANPSPIAPPEQDPTRPRREEKEYEILDPVCPGCPDPDNAARVEAPCSGPSSLEDPSADIGEANPDLARLAPCIGSPICQNLVYCPRTGATKLQSS